MTDMSNFYSFTFYLHDINLKFSFLFFDKIYNTYMKKYTKHKQEIEEQILENSLQLFCKKGLNVSMSMIASQCHTTRATLYKYFSDSDTIMWAIIKKFFEKLGNLLHQETPQNAWNRYFIYFESMISLYKSNPNWFLFLSLFFPEYQKESSTILKERYKMFFTDGAFGTTDTVNFLEQDFYDGSIRMDYQAHSTAVSAAYMACFTLIGIPAIDQELTIKYNMPPIEFAQNAFSIFLEGLKP